MSENFPRRNPFGSGSPGFGATKSAKVIPTVNKFIIGPNKTYLPTSDDRDGRIPPSGVGCGGVR
jgi:hypothetical protein